MKIKLLEDRTFIKDGEKVTYKKDEVIEMDSNRANQYLLFGLGKKHIAMKKKK